MLQEVLDKQPLSVDSFMVGAAFDLLKQGEPIGKLC